MQIPLFLIQHTAADAYAQEKPPWDAHELDAEAFPPAVELHEKDDISLSGPLAPQKGQRIFSVLSEGKNSCSNILPHFLHRNS